MDTDPHPPECSSSRLIWGQTSTLTHFKAFSTLDKNRKVEVLEKRRERSTFHGRVTEFYDRGVRFGRRRVTRCRTLTSELGGRGIVLRVVNSRPSLQLVWALLSIVSPWLESDCFNDSRYLTRDFGDRKFLFYEQLNLQIRSLRIESSTTPSYSPNVRKLLVVTLTNHFPQTLGILQFLVNEIGQNRLRHIVSFYIRKPNQPLFIKSYPIRSPNVHKHTHGRLLVYTHTGLNKEKVKTLVSKKKSRT